MTRRETRIMLALWAAGWFGLAMIVSGLVLMNHHQPRPSPAPRISTHATLTAHHATIGNALTSSYNWPQNGVIEQGPNCLAAASVTLLETYGLHVSQFTFSAQNPGANVEHAAWLLSGYLHRYHVRVATSPSMNTAQLGTLLATYHHPVLATLWTDYLPEWRGYPAGAHEVMLWKLTASGQIRFWDPAFGWETTTIDDIAAASWEYMIPVTSR